MSAALATGHARPRATAIGVASAALLALCCAACGPTASVAPAGVPVARAAPEPEPLRVVSGQAVVIAADTQSGLLSLRQAPLTEMGWPAMEIAYRAAGGALAGLNPGDRIAFDLELGGGGGGFVLATRRL